MDSTILASIIGGITTLISPFITLFIKNIFDNRIFKVINSNRKDILKGHWKGKIIQTPEINNNFFEFKLTIHFTPHRKKIYGQAKLETLDSMHDLNLSGGFQTNDMIILSYNNPSNKLIQFGTALFTLKSDGTHIEGKFVGYGPSTQTIVNGTVLLEKENI